VPRAHGVERSSLHPELLATFGKNDSKLQSCPPILRDSPYVRLGEAAAGALRTYGLERNALHPDCWLAGDLMGFERKKKKRQIQIESLILFQNTSSPDSKGRAPVPLAPPSSRPAAPSPVVAANGEAAFTPCPFPLGGYFVIDIMDAYVSRYTLIIAGLFECLFIGHVYGADRLQNEARALCGSGVGGRPFAPIIKWVGWPTEFAPIILATCDQMKY
jgi:hypothetical protein